MSPDEQDRFWMGVAIALLALFGILGMTRVLDLDDAQLRYPDITVPPTVYAAP